MFGTPRLWLIVLVFALGLRARNFGVNCTVIRLGEWINLSLNGGGDVWSRDSRTGIGGGGGGGGGGASAPLGVIGALCDGGRGGMGGCTSPLRYPRNASPAEGVGSESPRRRG